MAPSPQIPISDETLLAKLDAQAVTIARLELIRDELLRIVNEQAAEIGRLSTAPEQGVAEALQSDRLTQPAEGPAAEAVEGSGPDGTG